MTTLIANGASPVGVALALAWLSRGAHVRVADEAARLSEGHFSASVREHFAGDLELVAATARDTDTWRRALQGVDTVYQMAPLTRPVRPLEDLDRCVATTVSLLEGMREQGDRAPGLIYASSAQVYGSMPDTAIQEHPHRLDCPELAGGVGELCPLEPITGEACAIVAGDHYTLAASVAMDVRTCALRFSPVYGPGLWGVEARTDGWPTGWLSEAVRATLRRQPVKFFGDGRIVCDDLYLDDAVAALVQAADSMDAASGQALNIGGGPHAALSRMELLEVVEAEACTKSQSEFQPEHVLDMPLFYCACYDKALDLIGWKPQVEPEEGVKRTMEAFEDREMPDA